MSYPWAVKANTRTVRNRDKARLPAWHLRRQSLRLFVFLALSGASSVLDAPAARAEPLPGALPQQGTVTSGTASIQSIAHAMTINQQSQKVIIKWQSFNIGRDASVEFKQPDDGVAVNPILQGSPSEIFGRLSANGQVYLINQNGILFGKSAQIDTHSLVASTLPISDEVFNTIGLTNAINQDKAAFEGTGAMGLIKIESGAVLKSAEGGRIMIFAPQVENHGEISTPGGQAVLAASQDKVYLANSDNENLRGLLVEVDTGGSVTNLGKIIAERGNVSLVGLAVNQNGVVRATTSVNLNGSIRLVARDGARGEVVKRQGQSEISVGRTGTLTLGAGSLTEVAPDNLAQTAVDAQKQPLSKIDLMGKEVMLKSGARIVAPGGDVNVTATQNPQDPGPSTINAKNGSTVVMESGSRIDVSGLSSAVLPMERNVIAVELRGNELRDSPLQRNGPLRGETVYVDVRKGTPLADVSGQIATIQRPLDERLSAGGKVSIVSEGEFAMREGSAIDVSGGAIRYQDGYVNTTQLISQGKVYDIGAADPNRPYDGIYGTYKVVHKKWGVTETFNVFGSQVSARFEQGYVEGKDAGTAEINARELDLHGTLRGETVAGRYQRLFPSATPTGVIRGYDELPLGGLLIFGNASQAQDDLGLTDFTLRSLADLGATGFNRLRVYANGRISVPGDAQLALLPGGELSLTAGHVAVQGDITAPGGSVTLKARETTQVTEPTADLAAGGRIDVAGLWVNDSTIMHPTAAAEGAAVIDGGSVTVEATGDVALEAGSVIDAGGGAQLQRDGKLKFGKGGQIVIASTPSSSDAVIGESSDLRLEGELRAYSFNKGGSLSLTGAGYRIGGNAGAAPAHTVTLTPDFFERGGFNAYNLMATHTGITLAQNTDVRLRARNRVFDPLFNLQPTGTDLNRLGSPDFLPDYQQQPVSLGLSLVRAANVGDMARVEMESGSRIHANPGASIALTSDTRLIVDGTIAAPAGDIRLTLTKPANSGNEKGFDPTQAIWLGPNGQLLAKADFQSIPDSTGHGLRKATVRDGGTVTVAAERGYFVADKDSLIDVSGASQTLDVVTGSQVQPTLVSAAAGAIDLLAAEGMVLNGELRGAAGNGAGAAGGALSVTLDPNKRGGSTDFGPYPTGTREIILSSTGVSAPAIGAAVPAASNGIVRLDPEKVRRGGFDRLSLRSLSANTADPTAAKIKLEGDVRLDVAQRLVLDAPVLESDDGHAELAAAYVALGTKTRFDTTSVNPTAGNGSLWVRGQHVDLVGTLALRGFGPDGAAADATPVRIESEGDIRLIGGDQIENGADGFFKADREGIFAAGRLNSAADIELRADQVYTATATDYTLSVTGTDGKITIRSGDENVAPLSAGSRLTLTADHIEQHGTLRAPFGEIELDAARNLVLGDGSVTSVSGSGQVVPFGVTEFGENWLYPLAANSKKVYTAPPEKRVTLKAPQIALAPGSVVDITGGGDLQAREHLPGPGGSNDILDAEHADGAFAIVPTQNNLFGSYDPFLSTGSPVQTGDTIHLAGGGPLAAGEYALLPAGYALLPGAYLITPLKNIDSPAPGQAVQQFGGSAIVAGQRGVAGTNTRDSLWSAFRVENGKQVRNRAEYLESRADNFFAANGGRLNRDAGQLVIDATKSLSLGGTLASNATGGRGSEVDILADHLAVVAARTGLADRVELLAYELNGLNADSLLLGASRQQQGKDVALDVRANDVTVESGAAVAAPEVMLAASDHVAVNDGATITAADGDRVRPPETILLAGDSVLARISSGEQVRVQRQSSPGTTGTLNIAAGATLDASRSITLDASRDTVVDGELRTHNGSLSMAAARISLGETQGVAGGLVLSNERLTRIDARDLSLNSRSTVDLYGQVSLKDLNHVALDAAGLAGYRNAGQSASISADTITLSNRFGRVYATTATPDGIGSLNLTAREVTLGEGDFAVRGFSNTTISATEQITARPETGTSVNLHVAGDLALQASRITASRGADVTIDTQDATGGPVGKITLAEPNEIVTLNPVSDLGAKLELVATGIDHGTHIELPSGIATLHATTGNVVVENNASIDVSGRDLHFADITVGSPGGNASLIADHGNVSVGAARIDVSGAPTGGDAGKLSIIAPEGTVQLDPAQLDGSAQAGNRAGSFALDAKMLANNFSTLNAALNVSGFTDGRQFRLRTGDISIDADILAHDLRIAADAGRIDVLGRIDASGTQAGQVALYARDDVSLHGSSNIDAHATGAGEKGGSVTLASTAGRLNLQAGASVNVAGTDETGTLPTDTGTVHLRALRTDTNDDGVADSTAVGDLNGTITGAERIDIEAYKTYTVSGIDAGLIATIQGETKTYMDNAGDFGVDARFHLLPGVEIQSTGDLALNTDWDLFGSNWRYGGEAGVLTLRAAGDLNLNRNLSDGVAFVEVPIVEGQALAGRDTVRTGASWSYRLAGGADLTGADPLSVERGVGDVKLASGAKVRTGTGDIEIAAGRNLQLADSTAAIYTTGENRGTGGTPRTAEFSEEVIKELLYGADFLQRGGDIRIAVEGDIQGANGHQLVNDWLARAGGVDVSVVDGTFNLPASWAVDIEEFRQNIGALGGGDVTVTAGGSIENLSVAIPTTGQPVGETGTAPSVAGGGDLKIDAGGDIRGGVFYLAKGKAEIRSGGSVSNADGETMPPVLALADGQYSVRARRDLAVAAIVNPTVLPQSPSQGSASQPFAAGPSYFFTYTPDSAARLESIAGDVEFRNDTQATADYFGIPSSEKDTLGYYPGTLSARSLQGDIVVPNSGTITLVPTPRGDMELLAGGSIRTNGSVYLFMSDADPLWLPGILKPAEGLGETVKRLKFERTDEGSGVKGPEVHAAIPVHLGDTQPARIVANTGSIGPEKSGELLTLQLSKQTHLTVGEDVRNLSLQVQHANPGDISVVEAGDNILFPTERNSTSGVVQPNTNKFEIAGPGQFYVIAGKDVDLGGSQGIVSVGDQKNPALADGGASVTVMAGIDPAPDYDEFIQRYLVEDNVYHERLARFMTELGSTTTGVDAFQALPLVQQRKFILEVFFNELRESGIAAVESQNYERGFAAIKTLFPAGGYNGDVKSFLSRIYTLDDGDINLVVPGGLVNAGVASATGIDKKPGDLGIVIQRAGHINAFAHGDFLVNQSRVFALDGGDILIWSSTGDIDAGKGAKTALSIPPPKTIPDPSGNGNLIIEFPPAISGSGIRGAVSTPGREPGDTFLIAPVGVINAGDAGIGSAGNLTIAATAVIGADNIQVGGVAAGVPTDTGGLGAGLAGVGDIAATASKMAEDVTRGLTEQKEGAEGFLGVEVVGFGEDEQGDEVLNLRKRKQSKYQNKPCDAAEGGECAATSSNPPSRL